MRSYAKIEGVSSPPKPPPYGALIEEARKAAGLSKREAARRAGISDAWWRYVTEGRQGETPVPGTAETVAAMARAVGLPADRLEREGGRKDAADALRSGALAPVPARRLDVNRAPASVQLDLGGNEEEIARSIFAMTNPDGQPVPWKVRRGMLRSLIDLNDRRGAEAGLPGTG